MEKTWNHLIHKSWYLGGNYESKLNPVVIGGCARSGTTLLRVMLDSHENIVCGPESNLFCSDDNRNSRRVSFLSYHYHMPKPEIKRMIETSSCEAEYIEMFSDHLLSSHNKTRWAEKTPKNVWYIREIFGKFPLAKFIHVIRDGRDVSCSLKTHPKTKTVDGKVVPTNINRPLVECVQRWVADVNLGLTWREDSRYIEIKYEDLVLNTRNVLEKLFVFIEEPFSETMLRYHEQSEKETRSRASPETSTPIFTQAMERWRNEYDEDDKTMFKKIGGELLIHLGYEKDLDW